jgi:hypothetical protein
VNKPGKEDRVPGDPGIGTVAHVEVHLRQWRHPKRKTADNRSDVPWDSARTRQVVEEQTAGLEHARKRVGTASAGSGNHISIMEKADADNNSATTAISACGSENYTCSCCRVELSNLHCHCDGCKVLLQEDLNFCWECHTRNKHKWNEDREDLNSRHHHTGSFKDGKGCDCIVNSEQSEGCPRCQKCATCSCQCHTDISYHFRFFDDTELQRLLEMVGILGKKPGNYLEMSRANAGHRRCALHPLCLEDPSHCGGRKPEQCWCFQESLQELPTKEALMAERMRYEKTGPGLELIKIWTRKKATERRQRRAENKKSTPKPAGKIAES